MSDTAADQAADRQTAQASSARHRHWLVLGALAAVGLALVGGVAAGVAAAVSHASPSPQASSGPSLFLPYAGSGSAPGAGTAPNGAAGVSSGAVMGAPVAAAQGAFGVANGAAPMSSIAYPYPFGWCNGAPGAPATGPGITATGLSQATLPVSTQTAQTLSAGVQSNGASDVASALDAARQKLAAIRDALHSAGVPDSQITQQGLNVYANGAPTPSNVNVSGSLSATITDAAVLDRALKGVVAAGASNVNVWSNGGAGAPTPDEATLQSAIAKATGAAKAIAQSEAQAAGVSLGALQSAQAQPPAICGWAPAGAQMVVAVTLTYAIK